MTSSSSRHTWAKHPTRLLRRHSPVPHESSQGGMWLWTRRRLALAYSQILLLMVASVLVGMVLPGQWRLLSANRDDQDPPLPILHHQEYAPAPVRALNSTLSRRRRQEEELEDRNSLIRKRPKEEFFSKGPVDSEPWKIAWLLSFPNSGTSYTTRLVRHLTHTSTASNYGDENVEVAPENNAEPIFFDQPTGPFWIDGSGLQDPKRRPPLTYVLTKTHCGCRCEVCPPHRYVETLSSFRHRCAEGKNMVRKENQATIQGGKNMTASKVEVLLERAYYPIDRVAKVVHLIRDPFDNVVSRFRLERHSGKRGSPYPNNRDGFRSFCRALNEMFVVEESRVAFLDPYVMRLLRDVPCRADFIRWTEWHNLAFAMEADLALDTLIIHYDDYETRFNDTANELVSFLELEIKGQPLPFENGKVYQDFFTAEERANVRDAVAWMATRSTWKEVVRYF